MSNASLTPTGGWYADPMDAAQLRWWDGANWTQQTTPASAASDDRESDVDTTVDGASATGPVASVTPISPAAADASASPSAAPAPSAALAAAAPEDGPGVYIPRNSVFKMAEAVDGQTYSPEWSGLADISDEVALTGVPVQLALTATPTEGPPIPVSADAFPILGVAPLVATPEPDAPAWRVEQPLAAPIDQLFPISGPAAAEIADVFPVAEALPVDAFPTPAATAVAAPVVSAPVVSAPVVAAHVATPAPMPAAAFSIAVSHPPEPVAGPTLSSDVFPTAAPVGLLAAALPPTGPAVPGARPELARAGRRGGGACSRAGSRSGRRGARLSARPRSCSRSGRRPRPRGGRRSAGRAAPVEAARRGRPVEAPAALPQAPAAPVGELYAGPTVIAAPVPAPFDAPMPSLAPLAPGGDPAFAEGPAYEPLVARAIPQPLQFGPPDAPTATPTALTATPGSAPEATFAATPTAVPETAWPTEGTYQPHPGAYVPFDPNAVRVEEPVPTIPFSSRDPFNPASTSRPALRSYGLAPVGPSGSTYTPALVIILITPLLIAAGYALLFQLNAIDVGLAPNLALAGLLVALVFVGIGAAQFDRNTLAKRGYFDLASPFWILLSPLVYLGVRASRVRSQGPGGVRAVLLWFAAWAGAAAILAFSTFAALTAVTPDRIAQTEQSVAQHFVVQKVVPQVDCADIPSFAAGTVFNCTATAGSTVQLVEVTVTDWTGSESYRLISTVTTPAAAAPTAP